MPINDEQKTHRQHAVPQNIMDVEFKIIGDLTMRQFFYLMIFGAFAYGSFTLIQNFLKWPLTLLFAGIGVALAFVPLEERGLDQWLINFVKAIYSENQKIWKKQPEILSAFAYNSVDVLHQELITLTPTSSRRKLEHFLDTQVRETTIDPLDIPEMTFIKKVRSAYEGVVVDVEEAPQTAPPVYRHYSSTDEILNRAEAPVDVDIKTPQTTDQKLTEEKPTQNIPPKPTQVPIVSEIPTPQKTEPKETQPKLQKPPEQEKLQQTPIQSEQKQAIPQKEQPETKTTPYEIKPEKPTQKLPERGVLEIKKGMGLREKEGGALSSEFKLPKANYEPLQPITPDQHSGRRFVNLLPRQGEIVLPIRGERILKSNEEEKIELGIQEKAEQLKKLLSQIRQEEGIGATQNSVTTSIRPQNKGTLQPAMNMPLPTDFEKEAPEAIEGDTTHIEHTSSPNTDLPPISDMGFKEPQIIERTIEVPTADPEVLANLQRLRKENERLLQQMAQLRQEINKANDETEKAKKMATLRKLEAEQSVTSRNYNDIRGSLEDLRSKIFDRGFGQKEEKPKPPEKEVPPGMRPNTVTGTVTDSAGKALPGIILIIKNENDEPVRAIKTDQLGKFVISTPLTNGSYSIETDKSAKSGLSFDIIKVDAKGEVIPAVEITGK